MLGRGPFLGVGGFFLGSMAAAGLARNRILNKEWERRKGSGITWAETKEQVGAEATEGKKVKKEKVSYLYDMNWKKV